MKTRIAIVASVVMIGAIAVPAGVVMSGASRPSPSFKGDEKPHRLFGGGSSFIAPLMKKWAGEC